ncbi:MAG: cellulose biosynthesis protein BcsE, partial [Herbaspirillum sp.]|nr:cellulose biosynthesis protein BcsE [Herbaspirillum sp.]
MATLPSGLSVTLKRAAILRNALARTMPSLRRRRRGVTLAIESLPEQFAELQPQAVHVVYIADATARDALLFETARTSKAAFTTLALAREPQEIGVALRARGFGNGSLSARSTKSTSSTSSTSAGTGPAAAWPRKLNVLALPSLPDAETDAPVVPLARLVSGLRALKRFGVKQDALYIIEGADYWFSWRNAGALAQEAQFLANWCALRRSCVLLVFTGSQLGTDLKTAQFDDERQGFMPALNGFHGAFGGVASLLKSHGEMIWKVEFWRAADAMVTGESVPLRFTETGALAIANTTIDDAQRIMLLTRDENRVVATQASIANEKYVPAEWEIMENNSAVLAACRNARGVTVLLDYSGQNALADLCETIHTLRWHCGQALKIVVRERNQFMRHQYELLILSLGANQVIGRDVPFSRLQFLLKSLQGQLRTRPIASDFQTALSAAICASVCGYMTMPLFCEQIEMIIERGQVLHLPHLLFHLRLRPEIAHLDALNACILRRDGDICTADVNGLYLFLFGCRISDADAVMLRIFGENVGRFFDKDVRYTDNVDLLKQLTILKGNNVLHAAPDYSDALTSHRVPAQQQLMPQLMAQARDARPAAALDASAWTSKSKSTST